MPEAKDQQRYETSEFDGVEALRRQLGNAPGDTPRRPVNAVLPVPTWIASRGRMLGMLSLGLALPALAGMVVSYLQQWAIAIDPRGETTFVWVVFGVVVAAGIVAGVAGVLAMATESGRKPGLAGAVLSIPTLLLFLIFSNQLWSAMAAL